LAAVDLAEGLALLFFAAGFFFAVVFPFRGFLADALRTDFFAAITHPFYNNQYFW
jgi:hypothetical protein